MSDVEISHVDREHLRIIRQSVVDFMKYVGETYLKTGGRLLDIAPQIYEGIRPFAPSSVVIETLDIAADSGCTYIGDICSHNEFLHDQTFDYIVCTEVLEHTLQPFAATSEIKRILKTGGLLFLSTPFNFRIHGPLPDCWRFTEHGLRSLLQGFTILELNSIETPDRALMPIHYTIVAAK